MLSNLLVVLGLLAALHHAEAFRGFFGARPLVGSRTKAVLPQALFATPAAMTEWLDDMIYSGDIAGFVRRRSKDMLKDEFLTFVEDRIETCDDEDELSVLNEIADIIAGKLDLTDGMQDAGEVFERRLDKILFVPPAKRRAFIEENVADMTLGFIDYVQGELKGMADTDSKVVMASVLQMIGTAKQTDLLGGDASILEGADESLGEEYAKKKSSVLQDGKVYHNNRHNYTEFTH
jgi:hypothetical protein